MHKITWPWLGYVINPSVTAILPHGAPNGVWKTALGQDGGLESPVCLDFTMRSIQATPNPVSNGLTTNTRHRRNNALAQGQQPWKHDKLPTLREGSRTARVNISKSSLVKNKDSKQLEGTSREDTVSTTSNVSCGDGLVDDSEVVHAEQQLAAYCDEIGIVDAFTHLASKWGNSVVYICARGHTEICTPSDVESTMNYLEYQCPDQAGWVYNGLLNPDSGNNKYGKDVYGAEFC